MGELSTLSRRVWSFPESDSWWEVVSISLVTDIPRKGMVSSTQRRFVLLQE
jgi:hypothetical protein